MSLVIPTTRGGVCGICYQEFAPNDPQYTHVGGETHDGFHKSCFVSWLMIRSACPTDSQDIDADSLITRTDRVMATLKPVLINTACAVSFGILAAVVGGPVAAVTAGIVMTRSAVANKMDHEEAGIGEVAATAVAVGTAAVTLAIRAEAGQALIGAALATGVDYLLSSRNIDDVAYENIGTGMSLGGFAALIATSSPQLPTIALVASISTAILTFIRR